MKVSWRNARIYLKNMTREEHKLIFRWTKIPCQDIPFMFLSNFIIQWKSKHEHVLFCFCFPCGCAWFFVVIIVNHSVVRCFASVWFGPIRFNLSSSSSFSQIFHWKKWTRKTGFFPLNQFYVVVVYFVCMYNSMKLCCRLSLKIKYNERILLKYNSAQIPFRFVFNFDNNNNSYTRNALGRIFFCSSSYSLAILFKWVPAAWKIPK